MNPNHEPGSRKPAWFLGSIDAWQELHAVASSILAKEQHRRRRLFAGLASSATLITLAGVGLSQTVQAHGTPQSGSALTTVVLMLAIFVVVGGFQALRYLEQHALDINEERRFLDLADAALRRGEFDPTADDSPDDSAVSRLIRREAAKIRAAESSAQRLAPALWGAGLTTTANRLRR
jgi:hypothetical protein